MTFTKMTVGFLKNGSFLRVTSYFIGMDFNDLFTVGFPLLDKSVFVFDEFAIDNTTVTTREDLCSKQQN